MTAIAFHFNVPDKLSYACRFARKALRSGAPLVIVGPEQTLAQLDDMLWQLAPQDFVAHCRADADVELLHASPVVLAPAAQLARHRELLLNMGSTVPDGYAAFARLVEVVASNDEADRRQARTRWRHYAAQGHEIERHDVVLAGGAA
ncbi:MAG: DNA polymerase III subunit chi [Burkholderiaceae bacterium]